MSPTTRLAIGLHCVLMLALGACTGEVTGGERSRVALPSPAGDGVTSPAADSDPPSAETAARGRARPTSPPQQNLQDEPRASDDTGKPRGDDRQRPDDQADAGTGGSDVHDAGAEEDGGAPDGDAAPCSAATRPSE